MAYATQNSPINRERIIITPDLSWTDYNYNFVINSHTDGQVLSLKLTWSSYERNKIYQNNSKLSRLSEKEDILHFNHRWSKVDILVS